MRENGVEALDLDEVAQWAIRTGRYYRQPPTLVQQCRRDLARALRAEHYEDPQGREVRRMHPARIQIDENGQYVMLWVDIITAKPKHMRVSLQQRRQGIFSDCKQHKTDFDSYNENNLYGARLPLFDYDFNRDLEEGEFPTTYPDAPPED